MEPRVSVIVPVYNTGVYLGECLKSILDQTLEDIELIVVDDASTDASWETIQEYAANDPRVVAIRHDVNRKQGTARNTGMRVARGQYLGFIDSDDWIAPDMYERLWETAEKGGYDIVACGIRYTDPANPEADFSCAHNAFIKGGDSIVAAMGGIHHPIMTGPCNRVHRRELILGTRPIWFPEDIYWDDTLFSLEACHRARRLRVLPDVLYFYRQRASSTSHEAANQLHCLSMFRTLDDCGRFFEESGLQSRSPQTAKRIMDDLRDFTLVLLNRYLAAAERGEVPQPGSEFFIEAMRANGFLSFLMARAGRQDSSAVNLELENLRLGGEGVRKHFNYLLRAIKRSATARLRTLPLAARANRWALQRRAAG